MSLQSKDVLALLSRERETLVNRFSVQRIGLFGSVLRGTAGDDSDVDILVELSQPTFDHYMDQVLPGSATGQDRGPRAG